MTDRYYRRVIRVQASQSPNVRLALAQIKAGLEPTGEIIVPGVLPWQDYVKRRETWDPIRQCIGLDAAFWEGAETLLFPPDWLNRAEQIAHALKGKPRKAQGIGIDPGEGSANTTFSMVDDLGLIRKISEKTLDTSVIVGQTIALMREYSVAPENVVFDRGGGGKQHADTLRSKGFDVRTVAFGEAVSADPKHGKAGVKERMGTKETRYIYKNRRAEMYGELRLLLDPSVNEKGFGIPAMYTDLRQQLAPIPLLYDGEGRMFMLPKSKKDANSKEKTLIDIIGHSPDEADSLVLAIHAMRRKAIRRAGVA